MKPEIIAAATALVLGVLVAMLNYLLSRQVLVKTPEKYVLVTMVRQLVQIGFLAVVYFIGKKLTAADVTYPLVGAVLGMTVPMLFFTKKLLELNNSRAKAKEESDNG